MLVPEVEKYLRSFDRVDSVILYGIETQICIYQTAMDLLDAGY